MKKALAYALTVVILIPLLLSAGASTDATVKSYEERIADTQNRIAASQKELESIRSEKSGTWLEMMKLDELIAYNDELKKLAEGQLEAIEQQIEETKQYIADKEAEIAEQDKIFKDRMLATYMDEGIDYIELILCSKSISDFLTRLERVKAMVEYSKSVMASLKAAKKELEAAELKLEEAEETLLAQVESYEAIILQNRAIYEQKENYIAALANDEVLAQQSHDYWSEQDRLLNAELEEYLAELQRKNQSQYVGGSGGWPLQPGSYYHVSSEQGWRTLDGASDYHLGIDLAAYAGTPILSFNKGTVVISTYHWSYGNYVVVDHGGGITTLYAHMSECAVKVGDLVEAGQLLGHVGLTGNTRGYHLHFEYRLNGQVQNPRNYLVFP